MAHSSSDEDSPADGVRPESANAHSSHRTRSVRLRGLVLDAAGAGAPVEVCVNDQSDWESIYKNPAIRMKCLVPSCDTTLMAKRMSRSGLRFLAVRAGGCAHNTVEMPVLTDDVAQDPSVLVGGGGPEGDEHRWMKGRLFTIARRLGAPAVIEHSRTRADVFLPGHGLVLEYQRWRTDFRGRTEQRSSSGNARTIWLLAWQPPDAPRTRERAAFDTEVFENGAIYVAVRSEGPYGPLQRPWEDISQERASRLWANGSIVALDPARGVLVRKTLSLATVLAQIIEGDRMLTLAPVFTASTGRTTRRRVWVLGHDLARARSAHLERGRTAQLRETTALEETSSMIGGAPGSATSEKAAVDSGERGAAAADDPQTVPEEVDRGVLLIPAIAPDAQEQETPALEPARSRRERFVRWLRRG